MALRWLSDSIFCLCCSFRARDEERMHAVFRFITHCLSGVTWPCLLSTEDQSGGTSWFSRLKRLPLLSLVSISSTFNGNIDQSSLIHVVCMLGKIQLFSEFSCLLFTCLQSSKSISWVVCFPGIFTVPLWSRLPPLHAPVWNSPTAQSSAQAYIKAFIDGFRLATFIRFEARPTLSSSCIPGICCIGNIWDKTSAPTAYKSRS